MDGEGINLPAGNRWCLHRVASRHVLKGSRMFLYNMPPAGLTILDHQKPSRQG